MKQNEIIFHSKQYFNFERQRHAPVPAKNKIPQWFLDASKYKTDESGNVVFAHKEKMPSYKSCPAMLDSFISGYMLLTPCDIYFEKINDEINIHTEVGFTQFCGKRGKEIGFPTPPGYETTHFYWYTNWMPQVPKGYGCLYIHPLNRFDLPFLTISGFVDSEEFSVPGNSPFFIKKDFEGIIPAGTPYLQVIPYKIEDWNMSVKQYSYKDIVEDKKNMQEKFIEDVGTNYKTKFWRKKKYD